MTSSFYHSPSPNSLTAALTAEHNIHKDNSNLSSNQLSRKLRKMGHKFLTEGMAATEPCPDGYGGEIQRRIGVKMWTNILKDLPEYIPEDGEDHPPEKKATAKRRGRGKGKRKANTPKPGDDDVFIDALSVDFVMKKIDKLLYLANLESNHNIEERTILRTVLNRLVENAEAPMTRSEFEILDLALGVISTDEEDEDMEEGTDDRRDEEERGRGGRG